MAVSVAASGVPPRHKISGGRTDCQRKGCAGIRGEGILDPGAAYFSTRPSPPHVGHCPVPRHFPQSDWTFPDPLQVGQESVRWPVPPQVGQFTFFAP